MDHILSLFTYLLTYLLLPFPVRYPGTRVINYPDTAALDWTHIGTIWTPKADELPGPSTINFKYRNWVRLGHRQDTQRVN